MNFELNNKYFKGSSPLFWVGGLVALLIGVVLLFVQNALAYGIVLIVAALIYLGVYFASLTKDADITDGIEMRVEQLRNEARADYESQFAKAKKISNPKVYEFQRFLYTPKSEGGELKARMSKHGELFTSRYAFSIYYIDEQNRIMSLYRFTMSLIEDDDEMEVSHLPYSGLAKAWLDENDVAVTVGSGTVTKKDVYLNIELKDGNVVSIPCVRDASTETLIDDINIRYCKETQPAG